MAQRVRRYGTKKGEPVQIDRSGSTIKGPLTPTRMGQTTHSVLYEALRRGWRDPTGSQLLKLWYEAGLGRHELTYYLVERQIAVSRADVYFHFHRPGADWKVVGFEVPFVEGEDDAATSEFDADQERVSGRFDVVFETPQGIVVDELKTGRLTATLRLGLNGQIEVYRRAACACFGEQFAGLRLCMLMDPTASLWISPDGVCEPLLDRESA